MESLLSCVWAGLHAKLCWKKFGQGVEARNNKTTTAPYIHIRPLLPQRRETEVPRGNDLKKNSPNLIIYITALILINIAWPLPLQNPSFQFFFPILSNCTFLRGIYWAQICSAVSENKARGEIIWLWPTCRETASHLPCAYKFLLTFLPVFSQKKRKGKGKTTQSRNSLVYTASKPELQRRSRGNRIRHCQETQHFPTPSYRGRTGGWDHLLLPFFHFLTAFCLIFVTPRSLSQFFPGKNFSHILMDMRWQPGFWHLYPVLASAT